MWVRVVFVCKHFHEVAMGEHSLWTCLNIEWDPQIVSAHTERAGTSSLTISYHRAYD